MMEPIGSQLKKIRESRNISFEELKAGTKLQAKILQAIEENQFDTINSAYLKGFIKIYCKFLGLDPNDFIPGFGKIKAREEPVVIQSKEIPKFKKDSVPKEVKKERIDFNPRWAKFIFALPLIIILAIVLFSPKDRVKSRQPLKASSRKKQAKEKQQKKPSSSLNSPIKGSLSLTISVKQSLWLRIKSDGKTVFEGMLKKGSTETYNAKEKLELAVGNAAAIQLQLNGRVLPPLGSRGQVIKKILITKDGIDINK